MRAEAVALYQAWEREKEDQRRKLAAILQYAVDISTPSSVNDALSSSMAELNHALQNPPLSNGHANGHDQDDMPQFIGRT